MGRKRWKRKPAALKRKASDKVINWQEAASKYMGSVPLQYKDTPLIDYCKMLVRDRVFNTKNIAWVLGVSEEYVRNKLKGEEDCYCVKAMAALEELADERAKKIKELEHELFILRAKYETLQRSYVPIHREGTWVMTEPEFRKCTCDK